MSKWTFTDCITEINNTQIDNAKYIVVMQVYNLIEYSDNCSRTTGGLWQYHKDEPKNPITDSNSFRFKHALSGVRQFLVTESPLQMMKNVLYSTEKAQNLKNFKICDGAILEKTISVLIISQYLRR